MENINALKQIANLCKLKYNNIWHITTCTDIYIKMNISIRGSIANKCALQSEVLFAIIIF